MSAITVQVSEELAERLKDHQDRLPEILELGLRELHAEGQARFEGAAEVLEFLATLPGPEQILRLQASDRLAQRIKELLEKSRSSGLDAREEQEWEAYSFLEHLVRIAKAEASLRLGPRPNA